MTIFERCVVAGLVDPAPVVFHIHHDYVLGAVDSHGYLGCPRMLGRIGQLFPAEGEEQGVAEPSRLRRHLDSDLELPSLCTVRSYGIQRGDEPRVFEYGRVELKDLVAELFDCVLDSSASSPVASFVPLCEVLTGRQEILERVVVKGLR
jgi:hypothetical protein